MTVPLSDSASRPAASEEAPSLIDRLAQEMGRRWRAGEQVGAEEYLALHPELAERPEAALELIAEEIYLRAEAGLEPASAELLARFPQWQRQVHALLDCHRLMAVPFGPPRFPAAGETLGDFRLLAELGRGGHARVFLATQPALADRPVVLKLAPLARDERTKEGEGTGLPLSPARAGREDLLLSRLQHTHIVPLYSVHEFPDRGLRGLCQPYFGGVTLAELLRRLEPLAVERRCGRDVLRALQGNAGQEFEAARGTSSPVCAFLARASYVQVVCWLGACLADALHHAHERGLLHLDLKPSNVLIAADGQPMLLDFHLAHPPLPAGVPAPSGLGGTPGSMAPEHQAALAAGAAGQDLPAAVDGRADVYALGVLLHGALGGAVPLPPRGPAAELRRRNPHVTPGLAALLTRTLAPDPAARYPSAWELAADLRRYLAGLPLQGVPDRSPVERGRQWRGRKPHLLALLGLLLAIVTGAALLAGYLTHQARDAEAARRRGEDRLAERRYAEAREAFQTGLALAGNLPLSGDLRRQLRDGIEQAERGELAGELHQLCERVRPLYGMDDLPGDQARAAADECRAMWNQRERIVQRLGQPTNPSVGQDVRNDLLDLAILSAYLHVRLAPAADVTAARREALDLLAQADAFCGPSCVLCRERRTQAQALGRTDRAEAAAQQDAALPPRNAWEYYALARAELQAGDPRQALAHLDRSLELEPHGLWPNFLKGICAYRLGQYQDARVAFSTTVALAPDSAVCFYNRGRTCAALERRDLALADYDRALALDPSLAAAAQARADLLRRQRR